MPHRGKAAGRVPEANPRFVLPQEHPVARVAGGRKVPAVAAPDVFPQRELRYVRCLLAAPRH